MAVVESIRRAFRGDIPPELSQERQEFIRACADLGRERIGGYRLCQDYYDGEQRTRVLDRAKLFLEASGLRFSENFVETVVDTFVERLYVESFQVDGNEKASDWLSRTAWVHNGGDELQGVIHHNTGLLGDAGVIVGWDPVKNLPRYHYNRPHLLKFVYDEETDDLDYAVKKWSTSRRSASNPDGKLVWRLNIYLPDRIEKWFSLDSEGENWSPHLDEEADAWPMPWTFSGELPSEGEAEDPLGIAAVHFRNRPMGNRYGRSEARGAIPYQDQLNKQVLDLFYVMDAQGFQWPWVSGVEATESITLAIGDVLKLSDPAARAGQLEAADPRPLVEVIDGTLRRLSAKTGTPLHDLIKGEPPSGEALKTAESRRTSKCERAQPVLGNSYRRMNRLALNLGQAFGELGFEVDPDADIETVWASPETRNEQAEAMTAGFYSDLGVSNHTLLRRLGFDPVEEAKLKLAEMPQIPEPGRPTPPVEPTRQTPPDA